MGLDNIPNTYACAKAGTAVYVKDEDDDDPRPTIDCGATRDQGKCPWMDAMAGRGTAITSGMFGTPCWYRGKAGSWMLDELAGAGYHSDLSFYGEGEDGVLSPEYCAELGTFMEDHAEAYALIQRQSDTIDDGGMDAIERYRYAAWWLKWVAVASDGCHAWW